MSLKVHLSERIRAAAVTPLRPIFDRTARTTVAGLFAMLACASSAQTISTVAGPGMGADGPAVGAGLVFPSSVAFDSSGNLFIADTANHRILKVTSSGAFTVHAGDGTNGHAGDGGPATAAKMSYPSGVAVDGEGNLYVAERGSHRIRKVAISTGVISTIAGGTAGFGGDGGPAVSATFNTPHSLFVDAAGALFIADRNNHRIRKLVLSTGIVTTVAGTGSPGFGGDAGGATSARLNEPTGMTVASNGDLYIADCNNHRIRKVAAGTGSISTVAGTGTAGFSGDGGAAIASTLNCPYDLRFDSAGALYFSDSNNHRIRKIAPGAGVINTVAGTNAFYFGDGGAATAAGIFGPAGIAFDPSGNLHIADYYNNRVRRVSTANGLITTVAGGFLGDGSAALTAHLAFPASVAVDGSGNLFIGFQQQGDYRLRKVTATTGIISSIAGSDGNWGNTGDNGPSANARITYALGLAVDANGNLYFADANNHRIRRISTSGVISTVAGTGDCGFSGDGGQATAAALCLPQGVAIAPGGDLLVSDSSNHRIRRVQAASGIITTVAGAGSAGFGGDGGAAIAAALNGPAGLAVDASGDVYIADVNNNRVRRLSAAGMISTVVGNGSASAGDDSSAVASALSAPSGVAVDGSGNLYVSDRGNHRVRRVALATGAITTIAGTGQDSYAGDSGPGAAAALFRPGGIALDGQGNLFIADRDNHRIRKLSSAASTVVTLTVARSGSGSGTVTSSSSGINCGSACSATLSAGTVVTLTPTAASGSTFSGWAGGGCSGTDSCTATAVATTTITAIFDVEAAAGSRLANIATRAPVQTGDNVMIGGFIIGGSSPKKVLITARGPSMTSQGVPGVLANPVLRLYSGQTVIATNDDWGSNTNAAEIAATGFAPSNPSESVILATLSPGAYTAIVTGTGGSTGIGIVEAFEVDRPDVPLINIATRAPVLTGDNVMIGGFIIQGSAPQTVVVTARGPSLASQGVPGTLANPVLHLYSGQTVIASNDDWGTATNASAIQATGFAPSSPLESVILITLNPGAYTAIVTGANGATGIGIVEVFARGTPTLTLTASTLTPLEGDFVALQAQLNDPAGTASGTTVTWATSNAQVARVREDGLVTAISPGTAIITASAGGRSRSVTMAVGQRSLAMGQVYVGRGPVETVYKWKTDRCDDGDIPDLAAHPVRLDDGTILLFTPHQPKFYLMRGSSFRSLRRDCNAAYTSEDGRDPSLYNNREWLTVPYRIGDTIHVVAHNEWHDPVAANCKPGDTSPANPCWMNSLTHFTSTNGGASFGKSTPPSHVIAPAPRRWDAGNPAARSPFGYLQPAGIVRKTDGYYYLLFYAIPDPSRQDDQGICLMRTANLADPASWRAWNGTDFSLPLGNPYLATGSTVTPCTFVVRTSATGHVTFNSYLKKYVLAGTTVTSNAPADRGAFMFLSDDLLSWSAPQQLRFANFPFPPWQGPSGTSVNGESYHSLVDHDDTTINFENSGQTAYLYWTQWNDHPQEWDRDLRRQPIVFIKR